MTPFGEFQANIDGILMCAPYSSLPLPGSVQRLCEQCGCKIWISKSMYPYVDKGEFHAMCIPCGSARGQREGRRIELHDAQLAELAQYDMLDFAHQFVRDVNVFLSPRKDRPW